MANMARRVLDAITENPEAFNMDSWHHNDYSLPLPPGEAPACGTTLCAAGWAAHLDGWTVDGPDASKNGAVRLTRDVGQAVLGLSDDDGERLFYASEDEALEILGELAD